MKPERLRVLRRVFQMWCPKGHYLEKGGPSEGRCLLSQWAEEELEQTCGSPDCEEKYLVFNVAELRKHLYWEPKWVNHMDPGEPLAPARYEPAPGDFFPPDPAVLVSKAIYEVPPTGGLRRKS